MKKAHNLKHKTSQNLDESLKVLKKLKVKKNNKTKFLPHNFRGF